MVNGILRTNWHTYAESISSNTSKEKTNLERINIMIINHISKYKFSNHELFSNTPTVFSRSKALNDAITERGGLCMALNTLFAECLSFYGTKNKLVRCDKKNPKTGQYCPVYHIGIIALVDGREYFIDVGYGNYFDKAILLEDGVVCGDITVKKANDGFRLYIIDRELLYIKTDALTYNDINENYLKSFKLKPHELGLCKALFERIYNINSKTYIDPNKVLLRSLL